MAFIGFGLEKGGGFWGCLAAFCYRGAGIFLKAQGMPGGKRTIFAEFRIVYGSCSLAFSPSQYTAASQDAQCVSWEVGRGRVYWRLKAACRKMLLGTVATCFAVPAPQPGLSCFASLLFCLVLWCRMLKCISLLLHGFVSSTTVRARDAPLLRTAVNLARDGACKHSPSSTRKFSISPSQDIAEVEATNR